MAATSKAGQDDLRRRVPSVDQVLQEADIAPLLARHGRAPVLRAVRVFLDEVRDLASAGNTAAFEAALSGRAAAIELRLARSAAPSLVRVINATGVVVHTNLGRAPLPREAARRVAEIAASYTNLEYDLEQGERGNREVHAEARLRALLGVEAAVVVNNCAAAVLLAVNTFAEGREVIVSRGELVEIGGSFRIPEVLRKGGARLREVGTTNKTRLADYEAALGPETGLVLKVHRSNFDIVGFTEEATHEELAGLCRETGVPLVEDLGGGLIQPPQPALACEPTVARCLAAGVDLVTFSGDKLLGGPQAGLVAGHRDRVDAMRRNALYRALRVDKMTLAALDAVLAEHQAERAAGRVPVLRMLALTADELRARAESFARRLHELAPDLRIVLAEGASAVGGGAAPNLDLPTTLVALTHPTRRPDQLAAALRANQPPVVARVADDRLLLDLRSVSPEDEGDLALAVQRAATG